MLSGFSFWIAPSLLFVLSLVLLLNCYSVLGTYRYHNSQKTCYSCMSKAYQKHWPSLEEVYYKPVNFTDQCNNMATRYNIGTRGCSQSMCVTVMEPRILAGHHIGYNVIRGCASSVFRHGRVPLEQTGQLKVDASCSDVKAYKLLPAHMARYASNRTIKLCWCVGRLCNDYPSTTSATAASRVLSSLYLVLLINFLLYTFLL